MKNRWEESEKRREEKRRRKKIKKGKSQKEEDPGTRKGRKVSKHCVFPMTCGSGGSKSRLAEAAGAEPAGQMRDEKLHAVVARSTFRSQNVQNTPCSDHFRKLWRRKSARRCGAKHISKSKGSKHHMFGPLLEVQMSFRVAGARDCAPCQILEHQIFSFGKMILRDRRSTSYDLASLFRGRRNTLDRWSGKIAKRIGTRPPALHSTFHFWRKPRRIASFLMLSTSKNEEVSQNCFVFDIAAFSKLTIRQTDRQADKQKERKKERC